MEAQRRVLWAATAVLAVGLALLLFWPQAVDELLPRPRRAWVAIEAAGNGLAAVGTAEIAAGTPFTLHAVLEAEARDGRPIYYTEAPRLFIAGREVPAEALARWDRRQTAKVLWFTVEGAVPYLEAASAEQVERFRFTEFLRADWPQSWAIPGRIDPANDDRVAQERVAEPAGFGTQRYYLRIELYPSGRSLIPEERFTSPGSEALAAGGEEVATASVHVPGGAAAASRYFGLSHLDPPAGAPPEVVARLQALTEGRLAFSSVPLLAKLVRLAGVDPAAQSVRRVDLDAGLPWGEAVAAGDLVQVGARWVVLYRDAGEAGVLDRDDLCFDFARVPAVRRLGQIFVGEGDVDLRRLERP
jgi:hypothetical protein